MRKNLFIVHSSITWRMARAVIRYEQLAMEDCVFLLDRGYQIDEKDGRAYEISEWNISVFRWQDKAKLWRTFWTNRAHLAAINQLLEEKIGTPYRLFLPHSWSYTYLALIEHENCEAYAFIEEGTLAYNPDLKMYDHPASPLRDRVLRMLITACLGARFPVFPKPLQFNHPKYAGCYGMNDNTFPTLPKTNKRVVPPPFNVNPEYLAIKHILIPGPWIELKYCTVAQYRSLKTALFQYLLDQGISELHVKFHPLQYHRQESIPVFWEIAQQFSGQLKISELPPTASPEEIAYSSSANFYLAYSSVTIYASQFGASVYSYANPMIAQWPAFRKVFNNLPTVITENMTYLDL